MKIVDQIERIKIIHKGIDSETTGNPEHFAKTLHISKRQLYNILEELKLMGAPISYDKSRQTFYYKYNYEIRLDIKFISLSQKEIEDISGGFFVKCNFISPVSDIFATS